MNAKMKKRMIAVAGVIIIEMCIRDRSKSVVMLGKKACRATGDG